jgi:5-methyltetrahydrofolate corrinoid/iron sulfur protein methyltransferase
MPEGQDVVKRLDGTIINPMDQRMIASILKCEVLAGKDEFCMNYIKGFRVGIIPGN